MTGQDRITAKALIQLGFTRNEKIIKEMKGNILDCFVNGNLLLIEELDGTWKPKEDPYETLVQAANAYYTLGHVQELFELANKRPLHLLP